MDLQTRKLNQQDPISLCPDEIWMGILEHLPLKDLVRIQRVCHRMQQLSQDRGLWNKIASRLDPPLVLSSGTKPTSQYRTYLSALAWLNPAASISCQVLQRGSRPVDSAKLIIDIHGELHIIGVNSHREGIQEPGYITREHRIKLECSGHETRLLTMRCYSDGPIVVWDEERERCVATLRGHTKSIISTRIASRGSVQYIISTSMDTTIRVWNLKTEECILTFRGHSDWVYSAKFIELNKQFYILSTSGDATIKIWSLESGECVKELKGHTGWIKEAWLVQSARGEPRIMSISGDRTIRIWNLESDQCLQTLEGHTALVTSANLAYANNKLHIITSSGDGTIRVWEFETGTCTQVFRSPAWVNHSKPVYLNKELYILSGSDDRTIRLWDYRTGECIRIFEGGNFSRARAGHWGRVNYVNVETIQNELCLISGSDDGTVRSWHLNLD